MPLRPWHIAGALAVTGGALATIAATPTARIAQAAPVWESDYATAQAASRQSGKPLFVLFR